MKGPRYVGISQPYLGLTVFLLSAHTAFFAAPSAPPKLLSILALVFSRFSEINPQLGKSLIKGY